jgi:hypothetical protein
VSINNILYGCVKCSTTEKGNGLRLNICVCHSWEMTLNTGLEVLFNKEQWEGIREKAREDNSTKDYMTNDETSR